MTKLVQNNCFLHVHLLAGRLHRTCPRDHRPPRQVGSELSSSWWTSLSLSFFIIKIVSCKCDSNTLTNPPVYGFPLFFCLCLAKVSIYKGITASLQIQRGMFSQSSSPPQPGDQGSGGVGQPGGEEDRHHGQLPRPRQELGP